MEDTPLASLSLTHVHYNPGDPISYLCAWLALVPQALCVIYVTLIWSTREIEILFMFTGQMGCEALNFLLKRLIKEERPKQMYGKGYGMPSSHAQFATFFSLSLTLFLVFRHTPHPSSTHTPITFLQRIFLSLLALLCAGIVAASRIYLNYHTGKQVLVGSGAGAFSAVGWFAVTVWLRRSGWVEWGLEMKVPRMLRMRDLVVEEDLAEAGWKRWEEKRRKRGIEQNGELGKKKNIFDVGTSKVRCNSFSAGRSGFGESSRLAEDFTSCSANVDRDQRYSVDLPEDNYVKAGEYISLSPYRVMTYDNSWPMALKFMSIGASTIHDPSQVVMALDHDVQNKSETNLQKYRQIEKFAKMQGTDFYHKGATYAKQFFLDLSTLSPYVSGPNSVKVATPLDELSSQGIRIDKTYLGSCTNSRASDLAAAAKVFKDAAEKNGGKIPKIAEGLEFYIAAASLPEQMAAKAAGDWDAMLDAGAKPLPAGWC